MDKFGAAWLGVGVLLEQVSASFAHAGLHRISLDIFRASTARGGPPGRAFLGLSLSLLVPTYQAVQRSNDICMERGFLCPNVNSFSGHIQNA